MVDYWTAIVPAALCLGCLVAPSFGVALDPCHIPNATGNYTIPSPGCSLTSMVTLQKGTLANDNLSVLKVGDVLNITGQPNTYPYPILQAMGGTPAVGDERRHFTVTEGSMLRLSWLHLKGGRAGATSVGTHNGGTVYVKGSFAIAEFTHVQFSGCTEFGTACANYGGCLSAEGYKTRVVVVSSTFEGCQAHRWGGAIFAGSRISLSLTDTSFKHNTAGSKGGAMGMSQHATVNFLGGANDFTNNTVLHLYDTFNTTGYSIMKYGGATGATVTFDTCPLGTWQDNSTVNTKNKEYVVDQDFVGCPHACGAGWTTLEAGPNFFASSARPCSMKICDFSQSNAGFHQVFRSCRLGQVVVLRGNDMVVVGEESTSTRTGRLHEMQAMDGDFSTTNRPMRHFTIANGAGLTLQWLNLTRGRVNPFTGGADNEGGSIIVYEQGSSLNAINVVFTGVTPYSALKGGALYVASGARVNTTDTVFSGNNAYRSGGAIFALGQGTEVFLRSTRFEGNSAKTGGALLVYRNAQVQLGGGNNVLTGNRAQTDAHGPSIWKGGSAQPDERWTVLEFDVCGRSTFQDNATVNSPRGKYVVANDFVGCPYRCPNGTTTHSVPENSPRADNNPIQWCSTLPPVQVPTPSSSSSSSSASSIPPSPSTPTGNASSFPSPSFGTGSSSSLSPSPLSPSSLSPAPVSPSSFGGLPISSSCDPFPISTATCMDPKTAGQCGFQKLVLSTDGSPPQCQVCWKHALCPPDPDRPGSRVWPMAGYWVDSETTQRSPLACPAPSTQRCQGWNATAQHTQCGAPYRGYLCGACAKHFYTTKSDPSCRPCGGASNKTSNKASNKASNKDTVEDTVEDADFLLILGTFLVVVLAIMGAVAVAVGCVGGDARMGRARARKVFYWSVMSLQTVAQVGEHSTGYESPLLLKAYAVLSAVTSFETSEVIHPSCLEHGEYGEYGATFSVSNAAMGANLGLLVVWFLATFCCRGGCRGGTAECNVFHCCCKYPLSNCRRAMLNMLLFVYATVSRTAFKAIMCVEYTDSASQQTVTVLQSNPIVQCWVGPHLVHGILGWITMVLYCLGFPLFLVLLLHCSDQFDHSGRKQRWLEHYRTKRSKREKRLQVQKGNTGNDLESGGSGGQGESETKTASANGEAPAIALQMTADDATPMAATKVSETTVSETTVSETTAVTTATSGQRNQTRSRHCCDVLRNFAHHHERRIISVYSFVNYHRATYLTFKPIVDNNFHADFLVFRPAHMFVMLGLAAGPFGLGGMFRYEKLVVSLTCMLSYIVLLFWFRPMRKTKSWIFPVLLCVWFAGFCALTLSFMASNMFVGGGGVAIQDGEFDAMAIYAFSLFILSFLGVLIGVIIPCAAVYGAILGARGDQKKEKMRELLDKQLLVEEEVHPDDFVTQRQRQTRRSQVLEVMQLADDEHEIQDLILLLQQRRSDARHKQELEMVARPKRGKHTTSTKKKKKQFGQQKTAVAMVANPMALTKTTTLKQNARGPGLRELELAHRREAAKVKARAKEMTNFEQNRSDTGEAGTGMKQHAKLKTTGVKKKKRKKNKRKKQERRKKEEGDM